jgi:hypothetical protein
MELHNFKERKYVGEVIVWDSDLETVQRLESLYPNYSFIQEGTYLIVESRIAPFEEKYLLGHKDAVLYDEYAKVSKNSFTTLLSYLKRGVSIHGRYHSYEEAREHYEIDNRSGEFPDDGSLYQIFRYEGYLWDGTIEMYHALVEEYRYTLYIQPNPEDPTKYDLVKFDYNGCDNCRGTGYQKLFEAKIGDFVDSDFQDVFRVIEGHVYTSSDYGFNGREEGE